MKNYLPSITNIGFLQVFRKNIKKNTFSFENVRNLLELVYIMKILSKVFLRNFMESFLDSREIRKKFLTNLF